LAFGPIGSQDGGKADLITIQGDHYVGTSNNGQIPTDPTVPDRQTGENLLARWRRTYDEDTD